MPTAAEAAGQQSALDAAFRSGLASIDRNQTVYFQQYTKSTIPTDGFVFWVASGGEFQVNGSLHYGTEREQDEDQTIGVNTVIFTSEQEITQFNVVSPSTMWIGTWPVAGGAANIQIAFSKRGSFYKQADVWHYVGNAVYPALQSQLVSSLTDLPAGPIVSNSLPIWLAQNSFAPVYPSFLVPDNVVPPYVVAHIEPGATEIVQQFPVFQWPGVVAPGLPVTTQSGIFVVTQSGVSVTAGVGTAQLHNLPSSQLMRDRVRLTLYGFNNQTAIQFYASLIEYSLNTEAFGFGNSPAIRDDKRRQVEISALAQKKTIEIVANYYQATADAIARRLILSASITTTVTPLAA